MKKSRERGKEGRKRLVVEDDSFAESELSSTEDLDKNLDVCPVCTEEDSDGGWVACDSCSQWYHIPQDLHDEVDSLDWYCSKCLD